MHSHGDFASIQEALNNLPEAGGNPRVPGVYPQNILIEGKHDITIKGCGPKSEIVADPTTVQYGAGDRHFGIPNMTISHLKATVVVNEIGILVDDDVHGNASKVVTLNVLKKMVQF